MIKLYKKEQLEELKEKYSKEVLKEAEEIIELLDDSCGVNRKLEDIGGYIAILESKEDVGEIKANSIKGLLSEECTDIIKSDYGIDYYSS